MDRYKEIDMDLFARLVALMLKGKTREILQKVRGDRELTRAANDAAKALSKLQQKIADTEQKRKAAIRRRK